MTARSKVCFVIPTYNEARNITPLLRRVTTLYPGARFAFLIVDDTSPDGTGRQVRAFARADARVHLLSGARRGLGHAYVRGISHALHALGAEVVVQMDADFSHDPADARRLLARLESGGADVAIGSRYAEGGAIDASWSAARRLLSRGGNQLARRVAGLAPVRDCTAGFKAVTAAALRAAEVERIGVQGYAFQVVLLHRLLRSGARAVEEPIYFREREHGSTKLGMRDLFEFFCNVWWLRLASRRIFIKFALTGLSGAVVNLGSFEALLALGMHKLIASPLAIEFSIIWNFLINNYWTFAGRVMHGRKRVRGLKFNLVSLLTLALSYATFVMLSAAWPGARPVWLQGCAILPAMLFNYFLNSSWTFRDAGRDAKTRA
ncbi:MAG: glycosyltransferase family 2 protein [Gammaproteobacteria bacterium]